MKNPVFISSEGFYVFIYLFIYLFIFNTDNQSSPILEKVEGGGWMGAYLTVNAVLVAKKLEGDQVLNVKRMCYV